MQATKDRLGERWWVVVVLIGLAAVMVAGSTALFLPVGPDFKDVYRPAARELLITGNPFRNEGFFNAPWGLLPLVPLAFLPERIGWGIFVTAGLVSFGYAAWKLGARPVVLAFFLLSPPVLHSLLNGNIDWMVLVGYTLPPRFGLLLVVLKPQMGSVVGLFWLIEAWRNGGLKEVLRVFWPVAFLLALSFAFYGLWPLRFEREIDLWWNASLWPTSIPVGLVLLVAAIRRRDLRYAIGASPCLSPYVLLHSWSGALVTLVKTRWELIAAVIGLWLLVAIRWV